MKIYRPRIVSTNITVVPTIHGMDVQKQVDPQGNLKPLRFIVAGADDAITCKRCKRLIGLIYDTAGRIFANPHGFGGKPYESKTVLFKLLHGVGVHPRCRHFVIPILSEKQTASINLGLDAPAPKGAKSIKDQMRSAIKQAKQGRGGKFAKVLDDITAGVLNGQDVGELYLGAQGLKGIMDIKTIEGGANEIL